MDDKLQRANQYISDGNIGKAEELYKKIILEDGNHEAYKGLISIYRNTNRIEELTETIESSIKDGYTPEENNIYLNILEHYDSMDDQNKVIGLISGAFSEVNLPISVYKEYLLKDQLPKDMELIEMKCGDLTNDNRNEIAVLMASPQKGINMNYYQSMKVQVYNLEGDIVYEDYKDGGYLLYPKIAIIDLSNDGIKDLYYNVIYDSITNAHTITKVLSFKDHTTDLIYSNGINQLDMEIEIIDENSYRIYSEKMDISYDIILDESLDEKLNPEEELEPIWWEVYEKLTKDQDGKDILQTNFEIKGFGDIQVNYDYIDGQIIPIHFSIEPISGRIQ